MREEVKWFAGEMENTLLKHDWKGGWKDCSISYLIFRLREEVDELERALAAGAPPEEIIKEATDVSNFSMMIAYKNKSREP